MIGLALVLLTAVLWLAGAPWWLTGAVAAPALLWAPGSGWARWLRRGDEEATALQHLVDSAWAGMIGAWLAVSLVRELGLRGEAVGWALLGLAALSSVGGWWLGRGRALPRGLPRRELVGALGVLLAVGATAAWRAGDIVRPLDAYWYLEGAADEGHEPQHLEPLEGLGPRVEHGWAEAGAWSADIALPEGSGTVRLQAPRGASGRVVLAVRGPLGSRVSAGGESATVARDKIEDREEGPVRRYLGAGVAAVATQVELSPGEPLEIEVSGERLYVLPGTEAVWSMHADGALRFVHYYQLLNQVENMDWAEEILVDRRFTWHQPPGWSPLLALVTVFSVADLPGANVLFLWVLVLVGLSSVRLASVLAPGAPTSAWLIPGAMAASHGLLMLEPMSANFPDSLYAAAVLYVCLSLALDRTWGFALAGILTGLLRWPGVILATLLAGAWRLSTGKPVLGRVGRLWGLTALGGALTLVGIAVGEIVDLGFILWFETFPEHWHGDYQPTSLAPRIPEFYATWVRYTGGALLLAGAVAVVSAVAGKGAVRRHLWFVLGGALAYSTFLCTIDHHPTHYFLPLVALTGTGAVIACAVVRHPVLRNILSTACLLGLWIFLRTGQV